MSELPIALSAEFAEAPVSTRRPVPGTDGRTAWWVIKLVCGHTVERTVRYKPDERYPKGQRYSRHRSTDDVLPPPTWARCEYCRERSTTA